MEKQISRKSEVTVVNPLVGDYRVSELSVQLENEKDVDFEIDTDSIIEKFNPSIHYDGLDWIVDDEIFSDDKELDNKLFLALESHAVDMFPDSDETHINIIEMDYTLIHVGTETVYELKK